MDHGAAPLPRLAILIDAENVGASCWPAASALAARFGTAVVVRAYVCHALTPGWISADGVEIIDGRPADGPNAADFLMAMDAAVMAAEGHVDGFALLTGDDGFAAVAHGLKMRGASVYALIPFNGGPVARRLVAMPDVAVLVPMPPPLKQVVAGPPNNDWQHQILCALAQCKADDGGWVLMGELGTQLKAAGVKRPRGKLSLVARQISGVEWRWKAAELQVRRMKDTAVQKAPTEAPIEILSAAPKVWIDEDDEIPF